jgi:hypothetical protein
MTKIKNVELKKIYHFDLGSNFKIVRVLKLFFKNQQIIQFQINLK